MEEAMDLSFDRLLLLLLLLLLLMMMMMVHVTKYSPQAVFHYPLKGKVKQSLYRPGVALIVPGS